MNQATARGVTPALSFRPVFKDPISRYTRNYGPTYTKYEPVTHAHTDDYLWVNDALAYVGYAAATATPANVFAQVDAFDASQMNDPYSGAYDHSFSVFIAYNPGPENAAGTFADGFAGAYTYLGGPYTMMMWNSQGWGPNGIGTVLSHETGHNFWACDEYPGWCSCSYCETWSGAPRNTVTTPWVTNSNCSDASFLRSMSRK